MQGIKSLHSMIFYQVNMHYSNNKPHLDEEKFNPSVIFDNVGWVTERIKIYKTGKNPCATCPQTSSSGTRGGTETMGNWKVTLKTVAMDGDGKCGKLISDARNIRN